MSYDTVIQLLMQYRYIVLFPIAFFEGPMTAFIVGTLIALGYLTIVPALLVMVLGDFIPDSLYYYIGYAGKKKTFIRNALEKIGISSSGDNMLYRLWHNHMGKTLFFSKIAYGLSTPLLMSAGVAEVPIKKFVGYALGITFLQYGTLIALGYFMGNSFTVVKDTIGIIGIVGASVVLVVVGYIALTRYTKRLFIRELATAKKRDKKEYELSEDISEDKV